MIVNEVLDVSPKGELTNLDGSYNTLPDTVLYVSRVKLSVDVIRLFMNNPVELEPLITTEPETLNTFEVKVNSEDAVAALLVPSLINSLPLLALFMASNPVPEVPDVPDVPLEPAVPEVPDVPLEPAVPEVPKPFNQFDPFHI